MPGGFCIEMLGLGGRFSTSFAYYGLAMDLQGFGVDIYLSQLVFGAVDIPAKLASVLAISCVGRRVAQGGSLALAGICILANIFVPMGGCRDGGRDGWRTMGWGTMGWRNKGQWDEGNGMGDNGMEDNGMRTMGWGKMGWRTMGWGQWDGGMGDNGMGDNGMGDGGQWDGEMWDNGMEQ